MTIEVFFMTFVHSAEMAALATFVFLGIPAGVLAGKSMRADRRGWYGDSTR